MIFVRTTMLLTNIVLRLIAVLLQNIIVAELDLHFQQHDYQLQFVRSDLIRYNKSFLKEMSYKTFKYNRTLAVLNVTFTFKVDIDILEVDVQAYKFMSNEYRDFPMHFLINGCKAITANAGGIKTSLAKCGNIVGCPMLKGIKYYACDVYPDPSRFPPFIPNGEYKIEVQMLHYSQEVAVISLYVAVTRPFEWWKANVTKQPQHHH